jgi:hypothetical protein
MKNRRRKFLYFAIDITLLLILINSFGCSSPTETPKGYLTGTVNLEGLSDHSGIIIALYDLAYLDTTIVRINNQYPQIGVHINQHTEFDHRLQTPINTTETLANGSFEIKKNPTGIYNLIAIKNGWGFKYIFEIEIIKGDNDLSEIIPLYEEIHISGNISEDVVVATDHHLIIEDDTDFVPNTSSLTIEPGAVIRINPGVDLTNHGIITAQGEENNMFWVTANYGFGEELTQLNSLEHYNQMELSSVAIVVDDLIEWGKWDYANTCLLNSVNNLHMQNGIFRNGNCGFLSSNVDSTLCINLFCRNIFNEDGGSSVYFQNTLDGEISNSICVDNRIGMQIKDKFEGVVFNNYFYENYIGIKILYFLGTIRNNQIEGNQIDISYTNNVEDEDKEIKIYRNNIYSDFGIIYFGSTYYFRYSGMNIENNNFRCSEMFIEYYSRYLEDEKIIATNNYFNGLASIETIEVYINDFWDGAIDEDEIELIPFEIFPVSNAGITQ